MAPAKDKRQQQLSQEVVVDSESESDSSTNESEEGSEDSVDEEAFTTQSQSKNANESQADSDSDISSTEPSSSSGDEALARKRPAPGTATTKQVKRPRYEPPSGFSKDTNIRDDTCLKEAGLEGKELWHITCPSKLPLNVLKSVAFGDISSGAAAVTHLGVEYAVSQRVERMTDGSSGTRTVVLLPGAGNKYLASQVAIAKTVHFKQRLALPALAETRNESPARDISAPPRKIRSQPAVLRMRYKPPGFGPGRPGQIGGDSSEDDSDDDMADAPPLRSFKAPKAPQSKQRITSQAEDASDPQPRKAKKSRKHETDVHLPAASRESIITDSRRSDSHEEDEAQDDQHTTTKAQISQDEKDAKRRRKEERRLKRLQKEERRKLKEAKAARKVVPI